MYVYTNMCIYEYIHIYENIHTHSYIHTYVCIHAYLSHTNTHRQRTSYSNLLQRVAVNFSEFTVSCSVWPCVVVFGKPLIYICIRIYIRIISAHEQPQSMLPQREMQSVAVCCSVLQCVAVCCSVLQCVVECCSVLQCVAVCCSVL